MEELMIQLLTMLVYISIGIYLKKRNRLSADAGAILSTLVISIMTPCTILSSFLTSEIDISLKDVAVIIVMALVMFGLLSILGRISGKIVGITEDKKGLWEILFLFSNNIYIGFPMIKTIVGEYALVYASIVCIPCNALMFSYGLYLIAKGNKKYSFRLREILNPCTAVSILALISLFISVQIPGAVIDVIESLGNISTPLALIILGIVIAETFHIQMLKEKIIYGFCFMKLILFPVLVGIVLSIFGPEYADVCKVLVITSALPSSNIATMFSEKYQNDTEMATKFVVMSTVLFIVLIPFYGIF